VTIVLNGDGENAFKMSPCFNVHRLNKVVQCPPFLLQMVNWCIIVRRQNASQNEPKYQIIQKCSGVI